MYAAQQMDCFGRWIAHPSSMKNVITLGLGVCAVLSSVGLGCAAPPESSASDESNVTGVTDLTPLEQALKLTKDTKVNGAWSRGDDVLKDGGCYYRLKGAGAK